MVFAYQGFTHDRGKRSFNFQSDTPAMLFSIQVDLGLFLKYKISVQDGPSFCLQMLARAGAAGPVALEKLKSYCISAEDVLPLVAEREAKEADKVKRHLSQKRRRILNPMHGPEEAPDSSEEKHAV